MAVEIEKSCVKIQYEYLPYNLREYIIRNTKLIEVDNNDALFLHQTNVKTLGLGKIRNVIGQLIDAVAMCHR